MHSVCLTDEERTEGRLTAEHLATAVRTFKDAGLVVLENVYEPGFIDGIRSAYEAELEKYMLARGGLAAQEGKTFGRHHVGFFPPMRMPLAAPEVSANAVAAQVMAEVLSPEFVCSFFHTNTAYPDSGVQPIHRDCSLLFGAEWAVPTPCWQLVVNIPLCDFNVENGSTEVWPGTHLIADAAPEDARRLEERAANLPSIRTNVPVGSLILRDLRCWHRGMPNNATYPRSMMAIVYRRPWFAEKNVEIPRATWEAWPDYVRKIYRPNRVVEDADYRPRTWES